VREDVLYWQRWRRQRTDRRPSRQGGKFILRGVISTRVMRCAFSRRWKFLTFFDHRNIPTVDWHHAPTAFQYSAGLSIIDASFPHFPVRYWRQRFRFDRRSQYVMSEKFLFFSWKFPRFSNFVSVGVHGIARDPLTLRRSRNLHIFEIYTFF